MEKRICFKCGKLVEEVYGYSDEQLCDACFEELDAKFAPAFAPIFDLLSDPEIQDAIEAEIEADEKIK